jgi:hypothetical protein
MKLDGSTLTSSSRLICLLVNPMATPFQNVDLLARQIRRRVATAQLAGADAMAVVERWDAAGLHASGRRHSGALCLACAAAPASRPGATPELRRAWWRTTRRTFRRSKQRLTERRRKCLFWWKGRDSNPRRVLTNQQLIDQKRGRRPKRSHKHFGSGFSGSAVHAQRGGSRTSWMKLPCTALRCRCEIRALPMRS